MKSKIILALGLASSVFFGRYLLTPSEKANLQNSTTIAKVETAKPTQFIQPEKPRWLDSNATNVDQNAQLEIEQKETDLNNIENCPECLQKLKNKLLHGNLKDLEKLATQLVETNKPELALILADVSGKKMSVQRRDILLSALQKFNSPQVAKAFANYLIQPNQMPDFLRYQLATNINQMADRQQITNDLVNVFNQTQEVEKRNQLLAIDYPEMLAQVSDQALKNNDLKLFNQATEQLQSNPYDFAPDAILSLENSLSQGELQQMLNTLMERQGSGSRLDFIESQFVQGNYSPEEQTMMLEALTHSENLEQGANIIAKFSNSTRH